MDLLRFWERRKNVQSETQPEIKSTFINPILLCTCGVLLPTVEGAEEHRRLGHFDLQEYQLSKEQKLEILRIIKLHGRLSLGRSGKNDNGDTGCEVYYFCWNDAGPPRTPTLFWDDDPNISSAFAAAATDYATRAKTDIEIEEMGAITPGEFDIELEE